MEPDKGQEGFRCDRCKGVSGSSFLAHDNRWVCEECQRAIWTELEIGVAV